MSPACPSPHPAARSADVRLPHEHGARALWRRVAGAAWSRPMCSPPRSAGRSKASSGGTAPSLPRCSLPAPEHYAVPGTAPASPHCLCWSWCCSTGLSRGRASPGPAWAVLLTQELPLPYFAAGSLRCRQKTHPGRGGQPRTRQPHASSSPPGFVLGAWLAWHAVRTHHTWLRCAR